MIFRRRPQKSDAANINMFDELIPPCTSLGCLAKVIEVADQQVKGFCAQLTQLGQVFFCAARQKGAVNHGVKGFDSTAEQLGKAGERLAGCDGEALFGENFCCAASRHNLKT